MAYIAIREGRIQDFVWLEIDDIVTNWRATLYSSENAVANRAIINNDPQTAFNSPSIQAEILVHGGLNVRYIKFPEKQITKTNYKNIFKNLDFGIPF